MKILAPLLAALALFVAAPALAPAGALTTVPLVGALAPADAEAGYLHADVAINSAKGYVAWQCCPLWGDGVQSWGRINAERVDVYVSANRWGWKNCRWVIVRGSDYSHYSYYHPSYGWQGC